MKILTKWLASKTFALLLMSILSILILVTLAHAPEIGAEYEYVDHISDITITPVPDIVMTPIPEIVTTPVPDIIMTPIPEITTTTEAPIPDITTTTEAPIPDIIPEGIIYQKPTNIPSLRQYEINKDSSEKIWHAQKPESYIIPNNEWVKHVASQLYLDRDGRIKYKNVPVPYVKSYKGDIVSWTDEPFFNHYVSDDELFNFPANADLWQNADYYLSHGMRGDCEDWSIALVSMFLSGEMSIKDNGSYIRQVIPAKVVLGYSGESRDAWTEYSIYGYTYISSTGRESNPGTGKEESITTFHPKRDLDQFKPIYQFNDTYFGKYKNDM